MPPSGNEALSSFVVVAIIFVPNIRFEGRFCNNASRHCSRCCIVWIQRASLTHFPAKTPAAGCFVVGIRRSFRGTLSRWTLWLDRRMDFRGKWLQLFLFFSLSFRRAFESKLLRSLSTSRALCEFRDALSVLDKTIFVWLSLYSSCIILFFVH